MAERTVKVTGFWELNAVCAGNKNEGNGILSLRDHSRANKLASSCWEELHLSSTCQRITERLLGNFLWLHKANTNMRI